MSPTTTKGMPRSSARGRRSRSSMPRSSRTRGNCPECPATTTIIAWSPRRPARSTSRCISELYPGLLPAGGNLALEVLDAAGNIIGRRQRPVFGTVGATANAGVRIPAVAGQSYFLHVFGANADGTVNTAVVNGYDATIINTPARCRRCWNCRGAPAECRQSGYRRPARQCPGRRHRAVAVRQRHERQQPHDLPAAGRRRLPAGHARQSDGRRHAADGTDPDPLQPGHELPRRRRLPHRRVRRRHRAPAAGNPHTLDPNDSTFIGFAQPVAGVPHLYALKIGSQGADTLADGLHHITARVQMIDPADAHDGSASAIAARRSTSSSTRRRRRRSSAWSTITDDGLDPSTATPGTQSYRHVHRPHHQRHHAHFYGTAEADAIVRLRGSTSTGTRRPRPTTSSSARRWPFPWTAPTNSPTGSGT